VHGVGHVVVVEGACPGLLLRLLRGAQRPRGGRPAEPGGRRVAGRLGVDLLVPGGADRDQAVQEGPPRVGVDGEALDRARPVEQTAQDGGVLVGAGRAGEGP
jgi:hypothetical protein